ncbi:dnaJ homolog subfamily C member 12-like isoform X2 [Lineus longissimus]|uniref:dnaJ homolog subfamily C member 12-like isoform X2 n=1 Tax=Lineus longissimus TaxID=88925 RepID=UPI00315D03C3
MKTQILHQIRSTNSLFPAFLVMESLFTYKKTQDDDYYIILGCGEHSSEEQILTEYKLRALECHPDKNPDDPDAAEVFAKLNRAKEVLTDAKMREAYDKWRHSEIPMPFERWMNMKDSMQTTMHWVMKTKSDPMIESSQQSQMASSAGNPKMHSGFQWERDSASEALRKFRNYEI